MFLKVTFFFKKATKIFFSTFMISDEFMTYETSHGYFSKTKTPLLSLTTKQLLEVVTVDLG